MIDVIFDYLQTLKLKISYSYLKKQLLSHPDYPSILSVFDVLEQVGLNVQAGKIEGKHLSDIPFPYLLHATNYPSGFILINNKQALIEIQEKQQLGEGVILKVENKHGLSDSRNEELYKKEKFELWLRNAALLSICLLLLFSFLPVFSIVHGVFLTTILLGLSLGYVLIAKDLGVKYAAIESFCGAGTANQCDKVLTSEYSKLFGVVTFSDLVLTYFLVQIIVVSFIIPTSRNPMMWWSVLGGLAVISIPVIAYSIYYQWAKIKAWCRLCLLVIGVLALQIGFFTYTLLNGLQSVIKPDLSVIGITGLLFLITGFGVIWVKELIKSREQAHQAEAFSKRVKYDPQVFMQYLLKQRKVDVTQFEKEIYIGNPEAPIRLVMASNLFCNPCTIMHEKLNVLLNVWPDKLQVAFRFLAVKKMSKEATDPREPLLNHWLKHIHSSDAASGKTQQLIQSWFQRDSIDAFMGKYATDLEGNHELREIIALHDQWIKEAEITKIPTLFLNGFEFPQQCTIEDLTSMIPGLVDHFRHENELASNYLNNDIKEIV